ncbi:MAG TPA: translation initiation factor IF-2 [Syntrophaceae bacterium]|jgi:translation initiation factor IF-2|nr:translation initiation factor IF-2 [Syntrophaceae bacterium]
MTKKRVYELAKELCIDNKELISRLEKLGIAVKSPSSGLEDNDVEKVRMEFQLGEPREMVEQRIKSTVIRRRAVRPVVEEVTPEPPPVEAEIIIKPEEEKSEPIVERDVKIEKVIPKEVPSKPAAPVEVIPPKTVPEEAAPIDVAKPTESPVEVRAEIPKKPAVVEELPMKPKKKVEPVEKTPPLPVVPPPTPPTETKETLKKEVKKEVAPPRVPKEPVIEVKKDIPKKPELKIVKEITPAKAVEKPAQWEPEKPKIKGKKPVEVVMEELPSARKKAFIKKLVDKKDRREDLDRDERIIKWKEGKRPVTTKMKKTAITTPKAIKRRIKVGEVITVGELAKKMGVKASEVINKLIGLGLMVTINQAIECDAATLIAGEFGYQVEPVGAEYDESLQKVDSASENLKTRAPVVTIMGHVDHGKTSLLDAIRQTNVIAGEVGGITQAIGAYHVHIKDRDIVFLDTPGHEAFTAMRARGAHVTDIVVLVVAADDGVKDQTIEAINHARVAGVPIIVAVNKIDKPGADPGKIKQVLADYNLLPEDWGGETIYCEVSAKKKEGIEELLEMILLQADVMDLRADPIRPARGIIIEAKLDRGRGPVATVLIQEGTLREGDAFVSKTEFGKARALINDQGERVKEAGPSMPVEVIGFSKVPQVSTEFICVEDEKKARNIGEYWNRKERERELTKSSKITLEQLYEKIKEGVKELNVIIKGDVQGSIEALFDALTKLGTSDIKVKIIHSSTGTITETDVLLASASNAVIIGFNVRPDARVIDMAEQEGIEIKLYDIIYDVIGDIKAAMEGLLEPVYKEIDIGRAEVREIFRVPKIGTIAGSYVTDGKITRSANLRLVRDGVVVYNSRVLSLRRFKDDVKEVSTGFECGIGIEGFNDIKTGDIIEAYTHEKVERKL